MAHVALAIPRLGGGGAERVVLMIAGGLARRGHRVDIVISEPVLAYRDIVPGDARLIVLKEPQERSCFPLRTIWSPRRVSRARLARLVPELRTRWSVTAPSLFRRRASLRALRLAHYFEQARPDIVFANSAGEEVTAHIAARLVSPSPPVVPVLHAAVLPISKGERRRAQIWQAADRVVTVSRDVADQVSAVLGHCENKVSVIYNPSGTVPDLGRRVAEEPDHPWFRDDGLPVVLGAGRLAPEKDFGVLIDAFDRVRRKRPCRLVILGEGESRNELEMKVQGLGLEDRVSLPGWADNPFAYMARARLFVLSSLNEGLGNVLVEAMACGCPAVATDCPGGVAEVIQDPELLAPVGDPEALARVMLRALDRPVDRAELEAKTARFTIDPAIDGYEAVIEGVLQ